MSELEPLKAPGSVHEVKKQVGWHALLALSLVIVLALFFVLKHYIEAEPSAKAASGSEEPAQHRTPPAQAPVPEKRATSLRVSASAICEKFSKWTSPPPGSPPPVNLMVQWEQGSGPLPKHGNRTDGGYEYQANEVILNIGEGTPVELGALNLPVSSGSATAYVGGFVVFNTLDKSITTYGKQISFEPIAGTVTMSIPINMSFTEHNCSLVLRVTLQVTPKFE